MPRTEGITRLAPTPTARRPPQMSSSTTGARAVTISPMTMSTMPPTNVRRHPTIRPNRPLASMKVPAMRAYTVFASCTSATEHPKTRIISDIATENAPLSAETPSCASARTAREIAALEPTEPPCPRADSTRSLHAHVELMSITIQRRFIHAITK